MGLDGKGSILGAQDTAASDGKDQPRDGAIAAPVVYTYLTPGTAIVGVPARDLTEADLADLEPDLLEYLEPSGCYAKVKKGKKE